MNDLNSLIISGTLESPVLNIKLEDNIKLKQFKLLSKRQYKDVKSNLYKTEYIKIPCIFYQEKDNDILESIKQGTKIRAVGRLSTSDNGLTVCVEHFELGGN